MESEGAPPLSGSASRRPGAGIAITSMTATTRIEVIAGYRVTMCAHRSPPLCPPAASACSTRSAWESRLGVSRAPAKPSSAGSRVTATATAMPTVPAAPKSHHGQERQPDHARPDRAMITVRPAKTTAEPAVAVAFAADSEGDIPPASCERCRETMNRA